MLRLIKTDYVIHQLVVAATTAQQDDSWIISALGQFPAERVQDIIDNNVLLSTLQPLFNLSNIDNWLAVESNQEDLNFLMKQDLF